MFISCWLFSLTVSWKSQFDRRQRAAVLQPLHLLKEARLSNMPNSQQLGVCSPDPSSHTSDLLLARENWIFSACYQQRRKSKNELLPPEGHLTRQISTSNQFISKALSKLLRTRFWCKNPSVLSAERRHRPGRPLSNLVSAVTIFLQPVQLMFCKPRIHSAFSHVFVSQATNHTDSSTEGSYHSHSPCLEVEAELQTRGIVGFQHLYVSNHQMSLRRCWDGSRSEQFQNMMMSSC